MLPIKMLILIELNYKLRGTYSIGRPICFLVYVAIMSNRALLSQWCVDIEVHASFSCIMHYWISSHAQVYVVLHVQLMLRLERGGGQQIVLSCACFLITQPFF